MVRRNMGEGEEKRKERRVIHYSRKGSISGLQTVADHALSPSSSSNQDGRWCEGERALPLKKRRGSFERIKAEGYEDEVTENSNNKKSRMKTKMNKKCCWRQNGDSAVMEGTRCSRANGRGWRCCQQTLVGYSLCEHHLGMGRRLRSITSVKTRSLPAAATSSQQKKKPETVARKRTKLHP